MQRDRVWEQGSWGSMSTQIQYHLSSPHTPLPSSCISPPLSPNWLPWTSFHQRHNNIVSTPLPWKLFKRLQFGRKCSGKAKTYLGSAHHPLCPNSQTSDHVLSVCSCHVLQRMHLVKLWRLAKFWNWNFPSIYWKLLRQAKHKPPACRTL